jgi:rhomboid protease GluP
LEETRSPTIVIGRWARRAECLDYRLVLQSMGIDCEIVRHEEGGYGLAVAAREAARARQQIDLYRAENAGPGETRAAAGIARYRAGLPGAFLYVAFLVTVFYLERSRAFGLHWLYAGRLEAARITHGEWWRAFTALTLHADLRHLSGNLLFGILFGVLASRSLGAGMAWFAIIMGGALGNILNALIQSPYHTSLGASTAVFAALGILTGYGWKKRHQRAFPRLHRWAPVVGGFVLLTYLGMEGERTDTGAHVMGFATGGIIGVTLGLMPDALEFSRRQQAMLGFAAVAVICAAWSLALLAHG